VIYIFAGDKLTRAKYSIIEEHSNKNDYISDYKAIKELLTKKYGKMTFIMMIILNGDLLLV
jgi:hypothetical protein